MNKIYYTQEETATLFTDFFKKVVPNVRKTVLNILPYIMIAIIKSESLVAGDIAKKLKDKFSIIQYDSVIKRIKRFFNNKLFDPYSFYDSIIRHVISSYKKKHPDSRVHIAFDHMYSKDNYTVFMLSMRVGKQGIPLWFRCFEGKDNSDAYLEDVLKDGIKYVSSLFNQPLDLIFLADRWFNSISLLQFIEKLGHTYYIRLKKDIKVLIYDKKEGHNVWKHVGDLFAYKYHSTFIEGILLSSSEYKCNIAISKTDGVSEPWYVVTNGDPKRAIKDYGYRFGGIECLFKNQKSNGFNLERTVNASLKYFTTMYMCAALGVLFLVIIGADYTKNIKCYKDVKIKTHSTYKGIKRRSVSLFNIGLILFNRAYESMKYIRIPFSFILYDV